MKFSEIKNKSPKELSEILLDTKKEMLNLRFQSVLERSSNIKRSRHCKKVVARVLTRINQLKVS